MERAALDWDDVRYFLAAARRSGQGAAARALGVRQSTVSRRLASLEGALGGALFDRTPQGLALTPLGRQVLPEAERVEAAVRAIGDAGADEARGVRGVVRVALTETLASVFVLPRVLPGLLARHPELRLELLTSDDPADLARREADVALRFFLPPRGDLVGRRAARLETAALARRALARRLAGTDPGGWPWVSVWRAGGAPAEERWVAPLQPRPRLTTSSFHAQYEAVRAGLGVAVLPVLLRVVQPDLEALAVPGLEAPPPLDLYLVTPRALRRVPRVAAVVEALAAGLAEVR